MTIRHCNLYSSTGQIVSFDFDCDPADPLGVAGALCKALNYGEAPDAQYSTVFCDMPGDDHYHVILKATKDSLAGYIVPVS